MSFFKRGAAAPSDDKSEWRVQCFFWATGEWGSFEPIMVIGETRARQRAAEIRATYDRDAPVRVECEPWDHTRFQTADSAARFGIRTGVQQA